MSITSDNKYEGGLSFHSPSFQLGAMNGSAINGGFNFDLPLATVASFSNGALEFAAQGSTNRFGFLDNVFKTTQSNVNSAQSTAFNSLNSINERTVNTLASIGSGGSGGSWCFITTAICEDSGLPDDCEELTLLRKFRDEYMGRTEPLKALVKEYYETAPKIVRAMRCLPDGGFQFRKMLRESYLGRAVQQVKDKQYDDAFLTYMAMYNRAALLVA